MQTSSGLESSARKKRIRILTILGTALLNAGTASVIVVFVSAFDRYMYFEDQVSAGTLNIDEETLYSITRFTPGERATIVIGALVAGLGALALLSAALRRQLGGRATTTTE